MVQTIRPEEPNIGRDTVQRRDAGQRGDTGQRGNVRRLQSGDPRDVDGVLYRLGRLQRVLVDVRAQVRELRTYSKGVRADHVELDDAVVGDLRRRLERISEALDEMHDDFDITRDSIDASIDRSIDRMVSDELDGAASGGDVLAFRGRSLPAGA